MLTSVEFGGLKSLIHPSERAAKHSVANGLSRGSLMSQKYTGSMYQCAKVLLTSVVNSSLSQR